MTTTTAVTPTADPMNKRLGFGAMIASATGMGLVGFLSRGAVPTHVVDGETVKYVLGDFLAAGRMLTGALGFLLILLAARKWQALRTTRVTFSVVAGGLAIGMSLALYVSATLMTTIANAVFLIYTGPLFSAILARIFLKEKISLRNGLFLAMVFGGMLLTIGLITYTPEAGFSVGLQLGTDPEYPLKAVGDLFALGSGVFYGLALFFYRYRGDMDSGVRGFWNFVFGALGALLVMVIRYNTLDTSMPSVMTRTNWAWAAALFLVCGLFAIGFLVVAGKHLSAVELSVVAYWETVVALFIGYFVFGETMTPLAMVGGALIVIGGVGPILFMVKDRQRGDRTPAEVEPEPAHV